MRALAGAAIGLVIGAAAMGAAFTFMSGGGETVSADARGAGEGPAGRGQGFGGRGANGSARAPAVAMTMAEASSIGRTIEVIGEARALQSIVVTSEVDGFVSEVLFAPGKRVARGDMLMTLEDEAQQIALDRTRAQFPVAKANADRYAQLAEDNAASALEAEAAFNEYKALEAELRAAQFAVDQRRIVAPFDGAAGLTRIDPGDFIRAGDVITTLDDVSSILIEFSVPQETADILKIGQPVTAALASATGRAYRGAISAVDSRVDATSRTLRVEARFDNAAGVMLPGAVYAVSTTSRGAPAVALPGLAIQWDRAGAYVWKRNAEGKAMRAAVVILQRTDDVVMVEGAVSPGDEVVAEGADRVRAGVDLPPARPRTGAVKARAGNGDAPAGAFE